MLRVAFVSSADEHATDHLRLALDAAAMHTWSWDLASDRITWSQGIEALLGVPPGAFDGSYEMLEQLIHPDDRERGRGDIARAIDGPNGRHEGELRIVGADGTVRWFACRGHVVRDERGAPRTMVGIVWDVTARKTTEQRLARLHRLSSVVAAINQQIARVRDERELFERACRIAVEQGGFRFAWIGLLDEPTGEVRPVARAGAEEGYFGAVQLRVGCMEGPRGPSGIAATDGTTAFVDDVERSAPSGWRTAALERGFRGIAAFPLRRGGRVVGVLSIYAAAADAFGDEERTLLGALADDIGFALDALARDEARRAAEARHRMLLEHASDGIFLVDEGLRFIEVNAAACAMLGYSREELLALRVPDVFDPEELVARPLQLDPRDEGASIVAERRMRRRDGSLFDVEVSAKVLPERKQQAFARDIGARKRLEAQLALADRLASLGRIAAGVAHEVNNPLTYMALNLELAQKSLADLARTVPPVATAASAIAESLGGLERVRGIVRALSAFGRAEEERATAASVHAALEAAIRIAGHKIRHKARLVQELGPDVRVRGSELRLGQVFVNLLVNAADAIPEGDPARHEIRLRTTSAPDGGVVVEVSDTGTGIAPDDRARIFDPFFTTKPVGTGTGLGLAICAFIVTALGGSIAVESELGRGATFRVVLPPADARAEAASAPAPPEPSPRRRGRVLVVDDERAITRSIKLALGGQHDVTVADDGATAHALAAAESFDCILCDIMMPGIDGPELYERLRADGRGHERRIVFMTGGAFAPRATRFLAGVPNACIEKPFEIGALLALVDRMVERDA